MNIIRQALPHVPGHWLKGSMADGNGNHCGIGWVAYQHLLSSVPIEEYFDAITKMDVIATEQYPERVYWDDTVRQFASFNDHPDTTEDEVIAVMEKAAVELDARI